MTIDIYYRRLLWIILLSIAWMAGTATAAAQTPVPVIAATVKLERFIDRVEALGTLVARESVALTATVTERVSTVHFEDGQRVEAGDILVEMTNAEEHALIEEELSNVTEAKRQYDRLRPLVKRRAASQALLDQRRREYLTAKARLQAIESRLKDHLVIAPFPGLLGFRNISVGALVEPGDVVTTLDDDRLMKLDFAVPAIHLDTLRTGLPIEAVSPAFPSRTFTGQVSSIDSRIDPTTRSIMVRAKVPNPERLLKSGLLMQVVLKKNEREVVVIPEEALIPSGRENAVLIVNRSVNPTISERRPVTIGGRRPGKVEIVDGLKAGELVITHGTLRARQGQAITVIAVDEDGESLSGLLNQNQKETGQ